MRALYLAHLRPSLGLWRPFRGPCTNSDFWPLTSSSSWMRGGKWEGEMQRVHEALNFLGAPVGFLTERMVEHNKVPRETKLIVVPRARFVSRRAVATLRGLSKGSISILEAFLGPHCFAFDPWGRRSLSRMEPALVPQVISSGAGWTSRPCGRFEADKDYRPKRQSPWGVEWKAVRDGKTTLLYFVNLTERPLGLSLTAQAAGVNLLTGERLRLGRFEAEPLRPVLLRVKRTWRG